MPEYLSPGVYTETVDVASGIEPLRTDVAAFVGIAERGPLYEPVRIESWVQFRARFGGFISNGFLAYSAKAFLENGGRTAYFVRIADDTAVEATIDPALQPPDASSPVLDSVAGFVAGSVVTLEALDRAGSRVRVNHLLSRVDSLRSRVRLEPALRPDLDFAQPMTLTAGAAPADGCVLGRDGKETLRVVARDPGSWGNELAVRVGRSSSAATTSTEVPQPQDGRTSLVLSVVGFGPGTIVRLFRPSPQNEQTVRAVRRSDAVRGLLEWAEPLPLSFRSADPTAPRISLESLEFGLTVYRGGRVEELFGDLSLVPEHPRYADEVTGASHFIRVESVARGSSGQQGEWADRLPDPDATAPGSGLLTLAGGRDGVTSLQPRNFERGLAALSPTPESGSNDPAVSGTDEVAMVAVPDVLIQPAPAVVKAPLPPPTPDPCALEPEAAPASISFESVQIMERAPEFTLEQVFGVQSALVRHCETEGDRIALLDPPPLARAGPDLSLAQIQSWRLRFDTDRAALYYPWIVVYDPLTPPAKLVREVPPSGHVAGVIARTDLAIGVHKAPANEEVRWAQGLTAATGTAEQDVLNPQGINAIRTLPGRGIRVYGARTLSSDTRWRLLNVRRLFLMIEEALQESLRWVVFEPHSVLLRQLLVQTVSSFLEELWARGALAGSTRDEAFFVKCDAENNPPDQVDLGRLVAHVGVAPSIPAEFVIVRIGRTGETLDIRTLEEEGRW